MAIYTFHALTRGGASSTFALGVYATDSAAWEHTTELFHLWIDCKEIEVVCEGQASFRVGSTNAPSPLRAQRTDGAINGPHPEPEGRDLPSPASRKWRNRLARQTA